MLWRVANKVSLNVVDSHWVPTHHLCHDECWKTLQIHLYTCQVNPVGGGIVFYTGIHNVMYFMFSCYYKTATAASLTFTKYVTREVVGLPLYGSITKPVPMCICVKSVNTVCCNAVKLCPSRLTHKAFHNCNSNYLY